MQKSKKIPNQPAYVLHTHPWRESSLVVEAFTREHGKITLLAKGAKRPHSLLRPILLPLQPVLLGFAVPSAVQAAQKIKQNNAPLSQLLTLHSASWRGGSVMPLGDSLLIGHYINELLLRLLPRQESDVLLFDAYALLVHMLSRPSHNEKKDANIAPFMNTIDVAFQRKLETETTLRAFELFLLRQLGHLPDLDKDSITQLPLESNAIYMLVPDFGLCLVNVEHDNIGVVGLYWQALHKAFQAPPSGIFSELVQVCSHVARPLKSTLRSMLLHHCGLRELHTRQLLLDVQASFST